MVRAQGTGEPPPLTGEGWDGGVGQHSRYPSLLGCWTTSPLLMAQSLRLLEACKRARPEVYDKLMSEIGNGFSRRTESPDCGD